MSGDGEMLSYSTSKASKLDEGEAANQSRVL